MLSFKIALPTLGLCLCALRGGLVASGIKKLCLKKLPIISLNRVRREFPLVAFAADCFVWCGARLAVLFVDEEEEEEDDDDDDDGGGGDGDDDDDDASDCSSSRNPCCPVCLGDADDAVFSMEEYGTGPSLILSNSAPCFSSSFLRCFFSYLFFFFCLCLCFFCNSRLLCFFFSTFALAFMLKLSGGIEALNRTMICMVASFLRSVETRDDAWCDVGKAIFDWSERN